MKTINIHEAKTHLSRLVEAAVAGEEIVIAKNGKPFVTLTPYRPKNRVVFGTWRNKDFEIPDNLAEPDEELATIVTEGPVFPDEKQNSAR